MALKIIFAGTPEFAACALEALINAGHDIIAVYTQPDRPAGRGQKVTASPVKELALKHHLPIYQPVSLRDESEQKKLAELKADVMVVAAYGLILPLPVLTAPKWGCINIHASLLPRWRGAAPIQRAILAGDKETGITIMQMDEGLDTGPMLLKKQLSIQPNVTAETLHDNLAKLGAEAILEALGYKSTTDTVSVYYGVESEAELLKKLYYKRELQNNQFATYASKIKKEEAFLNWISSAEELDRKIRAFNPRPIAYTMLSGELLRVWQAEILTNNTQSLCPGEILEVSPDGIAVATGKGILRLQKIQFPGGRALPVSELLNSRQQTFTIGKILG